MPEPVVALLASDRKLVQTDKPVDKIAVVADLGGTRSDVAVISVRGGMYTVLATAHDYVLGGRQLDEVLVDFFAKEFIKKHGKTGAKDPREDARGLTKLRLEAESTKKSLSIGNTANFNVESLIDGIDFSTSVNRTRYELLASRVFARFTALILEAVKKAELDVLDIDEVLLAGGTSHTPRVASNVQSAFPESTQIIAPSIPPQAGIPSELAVRGAALQAELIEGFDTEDVEQSTHPAVTVTPHLKRMVGLAIVGAADKKQANGSASGQTIKTEEEAFKGLISAETPLPVRRTVTLINNTTSDSGILLRLCEGEREIKVTKPEVKPKEEKKKSEEDDEDDSDDDEDEEEEDIRERVWRISNVLGELALKDVKRGAKITAQITISSDLGVSLSASEVGKTGVRGSIEGTGSEGVMNGSAH